MLELPNAPKMSKIQIETDSSGKNLRFFAISKLEIEIEGRKKRNSVCTSSSHRQSGFLFYQFWPHSMHSFAEKEQMNLTHRVQSGPMVTCTRVWWKCVCVCASILFTFLFFSPLLLNVWKRRLYCVEHWKATNQQHNSGSEKKYSPIERDGLIRWWCERNVCASVQMPRTKQFSATMLQWCVYVYAGRVGLTVLGALCFTPFYSFLYEYNVYYYTQDSFVLGEVYFSSFFRFAFFHRSISLLTHCMKHYIDRHCCGDCCCWRWYWLCTNRVSVCLCAFVRVYAADDGITAIEQKRRQRQFGVWFRLFFIYILFYLYFSWSRCCSTFSYLLKHQIHFPYFFCTHSLLHVRLLFRFFIFSFSFLFIFCCCCCYCYSIVQILAMLRAAIIIIRFEM